MKKRGKGVCSTIHSSGLTGGNDPSEAFIRMHGDASVTLHIGSTELGQGVKTVMRQIAAEVLEVPVEKITVLNSDSANAAICTGQFASRTTLVCGNAVKLAAENLKEKIMQFAAAKLGLNVDGLEYSDGVIWNCADPTSRITLQEIAGDAFFTSLEPLVGVGRYVPKFAPRDNATGKVEFFKALQFMSCIAEVEVDMETGEVVVTDLVMALEPGKPLNPLLLEGQMHGGASFGIGYALMENVLPKYPSMDDAAYTYHDYLIPTAMDMPDVKTYLLENPSPRGPFGAKGCGEIVANVAHAAIIRAVSNVVGVDFFEHTLTPDKVLAAIKKGAEHSVS